LSEELATAFKEMSKVEREYAEKLLALSDKIKHPLLQSLFKAVAQDSLKHSMFYNSLVEFLSAIQPVITEEEYRLISSTIDEHIETEKEMIEKTRKFLSEAGDPRLKLVLEAIYRDEVEHHKLLASIKKNIAEREKFGEEELWDMVWKESPWHGTPGG